MIELFNSKIYQLSISIKNQLSISTENNIYNYKSENKTEVRKIHNKTTVLD